MQEKANAKCKKMDINIRLHITNGSTNPSFMDDVWNIKCPRNLLLKKLFNWNVKQEGGIENNK